MVSRQDVSNGRGTIKFGGIGAMLAENAGSLSNWIEDFFFFKAKLKFNTQKGQGLLHRFVSLTTLKIIKKISVLS